jgi:BirA family biotin operon repressor/biotin-[acetyl-CoA-carboxylase] ligase
MGDAFLDADQIRAATFVRHVELHDSLGSTNDRAAELAREPNIQLPALIVARHQTAGRGRGRNTWWSADGALTFSVLLEPAALGIRTANWPQLSLATAVAVCDALQIELSTGQRAGASRPPVNRDNSANTRTQLSSPQLPPALPLGLEDEPARSDPLRRLGIKWPNDVMLDGRKISGILIESPGGAAPAKDRLIIGIGINVNNSWSGAPTDMTRAATALCDISCRTHKLQPLLANVLRFLEKRISQLVKDAPQLPNAWQQLCCLTNRRITVLNHRGRTIGQCLGVAKDGALLVQTEMTTAQLYSGSVSIRDK